MSRAPQHVPSPGQVSRMLAEIREARDTLLQIDQSIAEDEKLMLDSIEGMTGAFEVIDVLVTASVWADTLAQAARHQAEQMAARAARIERRRDSLRNIILVALQALELPRVERASYTVSVRQHQPELVINEAALPDTYWRTTRTVDRALVRRHLATGIEVEGAQFGNASQGIMVRV